MSYGYTSIGDEKDPDAACIFCHMILAIISLAPAKLQRHMESRHSNSDKRFNKTSSIWVRKCRTENYNLTEASYKHHISLHDEAHIISKTYIERRGFLYNWWKVWPSGWINIFFNNTVSRRIVDIAENVENELISQLHACDAYALQIDESIDNNNNNNGYL